MDVQEHYRRLEQLYYSANIQRFYSNSQLTVSYEQAEIILPLDPAFHHGAHAVHGSVYFKLLDDAAYFAVASLVQVEFIVTAAFQLNLLRPVTSGTLKAVGKVRSKSKSLFVAEATLYNEKGKEVAFGSGQFMRTQQLLESLPGYHDNDA
ncbi:PaaI family thioesterase [Pontibacter chitinilyticus]|uniref:PaaI family thioesterase n=1 Tax=Pontibacter chitinilyticus TaxID=2674989 RepID=UPI00321C3460